MKKIITIPIRSTLIAAVSAFLQMDAYTQQLKVVATPAPQTDSFSGYYLMAFFFGLVISGIVFWWMRNRLDDSGTAGRHDRRIAVKPRRKARADKAVQDIDSGNALLSEFENVVKKNKELYRRLPILMIGSMPEPKPFEPLPNVTDDTLTEAIRQSNVDFEMDESVREAALKELSSYRTSSAVEAVAQMALYDLSSNLRSQALAVLTDYDHEIVFESILLACSDPARPVQSAAARALLNLSFDRTEAWVRILRTDDEILLRQSARAVIAAGFLDRTFDRLLHNEPKSAGEAFAIIALCIRAGETDGIFNEIAQPRDPRVARALLHVIEVVREPRVIEELSELSETIEIDALLRKVINRICGPRKSSDLPLDDAYAECEESEVENESCLA